MANHVLLDNISHKDLKVNVSRGEKWGDAISCTTIFPNEFTKVQASQPIVFRKHPHTGQFEALALFGFENNENLLLDKQGNLTLSYLPLSIQRQPFLIGQQTQYSQGVPEQSLVVHIDLDSPRINKEQGEAIFLEHGGNSDYLNHIAQVLNTLHSESQALPAFFEPLLALNLIEAFSIEYQQKNAEKVTVGGFYTINQNTLNSLTPEQLQNLQQSGYLQAIYMVIASLEQIPMLLSKKWAQQ
ncbi:SapC family protein [Pseudoalteromonas arctica]|uniref:SapC family protein n=1 Tax=Pseudoalteromonas arctica TaxID=394751 RepID=A0A7Y0DQW9_9GAMM|nr:SapC family protein [Pseudoalteromonas arctica]NMM40005.1 SapC family protein [Pseudoalteromonas arctica]